MRFLEVPEVEWKSPWRIEQEQRRAEEAAAQRALVKPAQKPARKPAKPYIYAPRKRGTCSIPGCGAELDHRNKSGLCLQHIADQWRKPRPVRKSCTVEGCGKKLNKVNRFGLCKGHYSLQRRTIERQLLKAA